MVKKANEKRGRRRLYIALIFILIFMGWVVVNVDYDVGFLFLALAWISVLLLFIWNKIPKKKPDRKLFSFDENWIVDGIIGIIIGLVALFVMGLLPGLSLLVPQAPQAGAFPEALATIGQYITVGFVAPLVEETFFRVFIFAFFWSVLGWSFWVSNLSTAGLFSLFHINAYAQSLALNPILAASGAFVAAFVFGLLFQYSTKLTGSVSTAIATHSTINFGIVASELIIIGF
jgi:membrane protease YdiL (CAAX protease family)